MNKIESESSRHREENHITKRIVPRRASKDSLVNCDNKTNHCNRYVSYGLFSGLNGKSKLSNDDESSHPINASNTNNKSERKRNINMLLNEEDNDKDIVNCGVGEYSDYTKRMKVDCDGQDNNKNKMYQVRKKRKFFFFYFPSHFISMPLIRPSICPQTTPPHSKAEILLIISFFCSHIVCVCVFRSEMKKCI